MLVLTRKSGEQIRIGDEITVTVLRTSTGRVKIGIDAPDDVSIARAECLFENEAGNPEGASKPRVRELLTV